MGIPIYCIIVSVQGMDDFLPVQNHWGDEDFALLEMYKFPACSHGPSGVTVLILWHPLGCLNSGISVQHRDPLDPLFFLIYQIDTII